MWRTDELYRGIRIVTAEMTSKADDARPHAGPMQHERIRRRPSCRAENADAGSTSTRSLVREHEQRIHVVLAFFIPDSTGFTTNGVSMSK